MTKKKGGGDYASRRNFELIIPDNLNQINSHLKYLEFWNQSEVWIPYVT